MLQEDNVAVLSPEQAETFFPVAVNMQSSAVQVYFAPWSIADAQSSSPTPTASWLEVSTMGRYANVVYWNMYACMYVRAYVSVRNVVHVCGHGYICMATRANT